MDHTEYDVRLAAYAVVVQDDQVLLSWWSGSGFGEPAYTLPGGGVELHETVEEAAVRECFEETGHHVSLGRLLAVDSFVVTPEARNRPGMSRPLKSVRIVFEGTVVGGVLGTTEVGGSTDRAEWVALAILDEVPRVELVDIGLEAWRSRPLS